MSTEFHRIKVQQIKAETADTKSYTFEVPDALKEDFRYQAGQHLTLRFNIKGKEERRSYSMSSCPFESHLTVTVKKVARGAVSNHLHNEIKEGDEIEVMHPMGRFFTTFEVSQRKTYYMLGAGSGITPLMSLIKTILEAEPQSNIHLLYGNRNEASIIFKDDFEALERRYEGQLTVTHILSQPETQKSGGFGGLFQKTTVLWKGKTGRIGKKAVKEFLDSHPPEAKATEYFICGPGNMIEAAEDALHDAGIDKKNIHKEHFASSVPHDEHAPTGMPASGAKVKVHIDGKVIDLQITGGKTILDALVAGKHDPPYSCTSGACATCMAKLISGQVKMDACFALDEEEVAKGYILTCQAHPVTPEVELTFKV